MVVTVGGQASNGDGFTVIAAAPTISNLSPSSGPVGTAVTVTGTNFGATQGSSTVTFNGTAATPTSWSASSIVAPVPTGATSGNVVVTVGGVASNSIGFTVAAPGTISFRQVNSTNPQTPQSTATVAYTAAQTGGDLNVVVVGWNDSTATISSVADSAGNPYSLAVGPTVQTGTATQAIYYAKNIVASAANTNSVTVTFSTAANYPDIRIVDYAGLDPSNPLDVSAAAQDTSTSSNSGAVTTTNANDLLVGANLVQSVTTSAGTGYTSRVITTPSGDILEDQIVATAGSYSATATISPSAAWIMQMVAFRGASGGVVAPPSITSLSPSSGPVGTAVTVTGTNFGSAQGSSTITFNGTAATPTSWSASSIVAPVPVGATTGNVVVTVGGQASNSDGLTVTPPSPTITSVNPSSGPVGTAVTVTGTNFGSTQGTSTITFNGTVATPASWSATSIVAPVPAGATSGNVVVTVGGQASNGDGFTVIAAAPTISNLSPSSGPVGTAVTVTGTNFGSTQGSSTVTFNGTVATPTSWSASSIVAPVPTGATSGNVVVTVGGQASNSIGFTVAAPGTISFRQVNSTNPQTPQSTATVAYTAAQTGGDLNVVVVGWNNSTATISSVADSAGNTYLLAVGPTVQTGTATQAIYYAKYIAAATANTNSVTVTFSTAANYPDIRIAEYAGLDPSNPLDVSAAAQDTSTSSNSGAVTTTNANDLLVGANLVQSVTTAAGTGYTSRVITTPSGDILEDQIVATAGSYSATATISPSAAWIMQMVAFRGASSGAGAPPSITSVSPSSGPVGTAVTVTGTNFGSTQGSSTITFNGTAATPTSWSASSIVAPVPVGATTGNVVVTVGGQASNSDGFTVTPPSPTITSVSPSSGLVGTTVTVTGTNFGSAQGSSTITFNGTVATPASWSATSIVAPVPTGATSGNVVVTVSNVASNGVNFTVGTTVSTGPTLVQHVSSSNNRSISFGFPNCYYFQLPNPATQGNAIIVGFTFSNNPTPTVTDDQNNSYAIVQNYYDSADNQSVAIAAAFNVSAGARNISVCFSSDPGAYVQPMATEFDNVIAVDGFGTGSNGTGTSVTAGSLQPTLSGDLAYQIVFSLSANQSSFTAGSQGNISWNLLSADLMDGWAGQYGVYDSTSVINPTMSMGTSQNWVTAAILLKQGSAGSVPSGMRVVHMVHENIPYNIYAGGTENPFPNPLPLQFPASGNLLVAMIGGGDESETITSMTDTNNNTWSQAGSTFIAPNSDTVQTYYAGNATSSSNLGLTLNWTGTSGDFTIFLYDVTGAASSPLDTATGATGNQDSTNGTLTVPYTLTPAQSGELIFTDIMWDFNTAAGLSSNTETSYFDTNTFSGESLSGPEPVDENNGWGHVIYTGTTAISFTWSQLSNTLPAGNWASMAVAFLPANPPEN